MPTVGILVIGNEILSGKVVDQNSPYLCEQLRGLGVDVERIVTIPDVIDVIAAEVKVMSRAYDFVFTSGGVGPTHDDLTMEGIAAAFGRSTEVADSIEQRIRQEIGGDLNESQLKMARIPSGATLLDSGDLWIPLVIVENVYILPGIPELLQKKFDSVRDHFRGEPITLKRVYVRQPESAIAEVLHELLRHFPNLMLGSYPAIREKSFKVLLTLESRDAVYVNEALESLLARLPADDIHKVE